MNTVFAGVIAVFISLWTSGQTTAPSGLQVVVHVEARRVAGQEATDQAVRDINHELPDGKAAVTYLTDGRAVRSTVSGEMFGLRNGTVRLVPAGTRTVYVLNPADSTYYTVPERAATAGHPPTTLTFHETSASRTVVGYKTHQVTASFRKVFAPPADAPAGMPVLEISGEIENWCTGELAMPAAMAAMIDVAQRFLGSDTSEYRRRCPVALYSTVRMSTLPGFELVSSVESVTRVKAPRATDFTLPATYRDSQHRGR